MPECQNHPARVGRMQSLAHVLGHDTDGAPRRPTLTGNYSEPQLPWKERKQWLRQVNRLAANCTAKKESYPHKVTAVARALAFAGDVCKPSIEYIAGQAGCVENTVKACIAWLEERGALTWSHTARKHQSGRMVRSSNLYKLIRRFCRRHGHDRTHDARDLARPQNRCGFKRQRLPRRYKYNLFILMLMAP